jgi:DNA invertase Pin-like site-specific DNA recombinase
MRVAGYIRVSTERQDTLRQEHEITQFCITRGYQLVKICAEPAAASGRADQVKKSPGARLSYYSRLLTENFADLARTGYGELLDLARRREIDAAVLLSLDRISRDCIELLLLQVILQKYACPMISISQGGELRTDTAAGKFLFRMLAAQSEMECDLLAERIKHTLSVLKDVRGDGWCTCPPCGWVKKGDRFVHDPKKWPLIEEAFALHSGGLSVADIAVVMGISEKRARNYHRAYLAAAPKTKEEIEEEKNGKSD